VVGAVAAEGWSVRECIEHLAVFDEVATRVAATGIMPSKAIPELTAKASSLGIEALIDWWRSQRAQLESALRVLDPKTRLPWAIPMSARSFATARLMECWAHGLDALDVLEIEGETTDRLHHIAHLGYITRDFAYRTRGREPNAEPLHVEVVGPSGALWRWGSEDADSRVTGSALEFCRVATQRVNYLDTELVAIGPAAVEFLQIAQTFAVRQAKAELPKARDDTE